MKGRIEESYSVSCRTEGCKEHEILVGNRTWTKGARQDFIERLVKKGWRTTAGFWTCPKCLSGEVTTKAS